MVPADELFEIVENGSRAHGPTEAVLTTMRRLGFFQLINARPSRERDLVVAMVAARILKPQSKLATTRWWLSTTLRAHIFLCMLAYYVQWHMMEAWRPLLFADEDQDGKTTRDPVAAAERSEPALQKVHSKRLADDSKVHSFRTLLDDLACIVRNVCRCPGLGLTRATRP